MPKYSKERKESVLTQLLELGLCSIADIARKEGISEQTLYSWRTKARSSGAFMPNNNSSDKWDKQTESQLGQPYSKP